MCEKVRDFFLVRIIFSRLYALVAISASVYIYFIIIYYFLSLFVHSFFTHHHFFIHFFQANRRASCNHWFGFEIVPFGDSRPRRLGAPGGA